MARQRPQAPKPPNPQPDLDDVDHPHPSEGAGREDRDYINAKKLRAWLIRQNP